MRKTLAVVAAAVIAGLMIVVASSGGARESDEASASSGTSSSGTVQTIIHDGRIGCAVGGAVFPLATTDICGKYGLTETSGEVPLPVLPQQPITGAYFVLTWSPGLRSLTPALAGDALRFVHPLPKTEDLTFSTSGSVHANTVEGTSPLWIRIVAVDVADPLYVASGPLPSEVRPTWASAEEVVAAPPLGDATGVLVDQAFRLCVMFAYDGMALPATCGP